MQTEQVGPEWDALRHAELLAALNNGPLQKRDKTLFRTADFMRSDPWAPPDPAAPQRDPQADFFALLDASAKG